VCDRLSSHCRIIGIAFGGDYTRFHTFARTPGRNRP
jgi:hypothetical protein